MMTIRARDAQPGFYLSSGGRVLKLVRRSQVSGRWPEGRADGVPYKALGDPNGRHATTIYGWLPPEYELRPATKPRWWRKQEAAQVRNLVAARGARKGGGGDAGGAMNDSK